MNKQVRRAAIGGIVIGTGFLQGAIVGWPAFVAHLAVGSFFIWQACQDK